MDRFGRRAVQRRGSLAAVGGWALAAGVAALPAGWARGDIVLLKDGTKLDGDIRRTNDGWVVTGDDRKPRLVPFDRVASIEARPKGAVGSAADVALASLRRASESNSDLKQIIDRYQDFITRNDGTPVAEKAKADLVVWQERANKGLVKVGDRWVTADERAAIQARSLDKARDIAELLRQARLREAAANLDRALAENSQVAALWYLRGVLSFRQDEIVNARKAFDQATALAPDHAATLNNLGVVAWRQNQRVAALLFYDRALLAAPNSPDILNNLAEALNALPESERKGDAVKKVVRHFNEREAAAEADMARRGLYRWGATWVNKTDLDKLQAAEREIQAKLAAMSADFDNLTGRIARLEAQIDSVERTMRRMEADSYAYDAAGRLVHYPLPPSYYDMDRDLASMRAERAQDLARQETLRRDAKRAQQQLPTPKYTGTQRLTDIEGTPIPGDPIAPPAAPLPAPAAAPAGPPGPPPAPVAPPAGVPDFTPPPEAPAAPPSATPPAPAAPTAPPATGPAAEGGGSSRPPPIPPEKPSVLDRGPADPAGRGLPPR